MTSQPLSGARPILYLHAGLHKTGTTALQQSLERNAGLLRDAGLLYPSIGKPADLSGHHNLAWELARDRRFRHGFGTWAEAAAEIAAHGGDAVISSEDFESVLEEPICFNALRQDSPLQGHELVIVLYLREQKSYLNSLYLELTKHGLTDEFLRVAASVCESGQFRLNEWTFYFDYDRLLRQLARWGGARIIVRNYHALVGGSTITDFLSFACPAAVVPADDLHLDANPRLSLYEAMEGFFTARLGHPLNAAQNDAITTFAAEHAGGGVSPEIEAKLAAVFAPSNDRLGSRLAEVTRNWPNRRSAEARSLTLDKLFSFETQNLLTDLEEAEAQTQSVEQSSVQQ